MKDEEGIGPGPDDDATGFSGSSEADSLVSSLRVISTALGQPAPDLRLLILEAGNRWAELIAASNVAAALVIKGISVDKVPELAHGIAAVLSHRIIEAGKESH